MNPEQSIDQAAHLLQSGKPGKAAQILKRVIQKVPSHAHAHHLYGLSLFQERQFTMAARSVGKAIALEPGNPVFRNNLGLILIADGQADKAIDTHTEAINLDPSRPDSYFHRANVYRHEGDFVRAVEDYEQVLKWDPYAVEAMSNLASVLISLFEYERAGKLLDDALVIRPGFAHAWNNLGLLRQQTDQPDEAESAFSKAIECAADFLEAHVNLGSLLMRLNRYAQAVQVFQKVLKLNPAQAFIYGNLAYCQSMLCDWSQYRQVWSRIEEQTRRGGLACGPIIFLNGSDDPVLARKLALAYTRFFVPDLAMAPFVHRPRQSTKLRIGYFSTDYREHPVATLIVGVLEQHDREQFEIYGYALNKDDGSAMRKRMHQAFDQFIDISGMADEKVVEMTREHQLDIAVDLNGYTEGCRPAIFGTRVAPVQLSYLGFPGTSGAAHFDYTVADRHIIPQDSQAFYTEQLLYMPECFQPNDDSRTLSTDKLTRGEFGLPEDAVVFCCFNKLYKLNPEVFTSWMQILQQVKGSVLWLYTEDETARQNLRREATKTGVSPERLVFAGRTEKYEHHLARYRLADLFLDTFPYTAHTTASDAMWAGLPVLTRSGQSLASRVGESLLMTLGMDELVTRTIPEFINKAVELANEGEPGSRQGFERLKSMLGKARQDSSLYDTKQYARWLELGYRMVHARASEGLSPQTLSVPR
ncbi:tetratricopeptide repeat protein [Orrella marina]|uniref:tetratricopeptide repeat protein n=1 Tax=Orrella marina TaxID=2163011 RepID=UPI00131EDD13|nr:tetratricopeptide repeat protein [Orrella marina]